MKKFGFTRKILDGFHDFVSEQPVLESQRLFEEKRQCSLDVKQKHTFYR